RRGYGSGARSRHPVGGIGDPVAAFAPHPMSTHTSTPSSHRRRMLLLAAVLLLAVALRPAVAHVRAASLLLRCADEHAEGLLVDAGRHTVDEEAAMVATSRGPVRARVYAPRGLPGAPGVVLVHGVHRLGIDEPRLVRFSRAIASSGVVVLTPE